MGKYSLEYFYLECNSNRHCIEVDLKQPIKIGDKMQYELFVLEVLMSENEAKQVKENITRSIDTNQGEIKVSAFVDRQSPFEATEMTIDLDNILEIHQR